MSHVDGENTAFLRSCVVNVISLIFTHHFTNFSTLTPFLSLQNLTTLNQWLSSATVVRIRVGITQCHTPLFDQILTHFTRLFEPGFFVISDEISAERYFKIPHF